MKKFNYTKVNAFTKDSSLGNPAAFLELMEEQLTPEEMLSVAKEHKGFVSEFVFVSKTDKADVKLTYYSSECEVEFCGHGTIATMHNLISKYPWLRMKSTVKIETNCKGCLDVINNIDKDDTVLITAPEGKLMDMGNITIGKICEELGIEATDIDDSMPIQKVDCGLRTLMVPIKKLETEIKIFPNEQKLKEFTIANDLDNILIYSKETQSSKAFAHTRVFAPRFGYLEDPATGSSNSGFGYYAYWLGWWNGESMQVEQGNENMVYNAVNLEVRDGKVMFGGSAKRIIDGSYYL